MDTDFDAIASGELAQLRRVRRRDLGDDDHRRAGPRARLLQPVLRRLAGDGRDEGVRAADSLDDLGGKKIAVQSGTTGELYLTDNAPADTEIVPLEDAAAMDDALENGDVDAAVYDNTVVGDVVSPTPRLQVAAEFDTGEQYGMAVKKDGNIDLLRTINNVLADLKADGGYDKIYEKWFGASAKS